jgi:hypothetical protein
MLDSTIDRVFTSGSAGRRSVTGGANLARIPSFTAGSRPRIRGGRVSRETGVLAIPVSVGSMLHVKRSSVAIPDTRVRGPSAR